MKKTLALVLALVMVLALVPAAFAAVNTVVSSDNGYKAVVSLLVPPTDANYASIENTVGYTLADTKTAQAPALKLAVPYDALLKANDGGLWDSDYVPVFFTVSGFKAFDVAGFAPADFSVKVNGKDATIDGTDIKFTMGNLSSASATYSFDVVLVGKNAAGDTVTESMKLTLNYQNNAKPVYDLKFGSANNATLKDGVYFIDSATPAVNDPDSMKIEIFKNDGSKFNETFYWGTGTAAYPTPSVKGSGSEINFGMVTGNADGDVVDYYIAVETQYAIYRGKVTFKYRANVARSDPKGVYFAQDVYTIGVNEVLVPTFKTAVPVYHDVADYILIAVTANSEKNVIDCDNTNGPKITGLKEGTAYVNLSYGDPFTMFDGGIPFYTDTAKVIVSGTYQVKPDANYIVTTKSGSLNIRAAASTSAKKIGSLAKGAKVEVVEIKDGWAKIIMPGYTNAYVSAAYLTKEGTSPAAPIVGTKTVICRVLNVRAGAGTSFKIVGKLTRNTKVEVIETVNGGKWAKINYNGDVAYVSTTYIQ